MDWRVKPGNDAEQGLAKGVKGHTFALWKRGTGALTLKSKPD